MSPGFRRDLTSSIFVKAVPDGLPFGAASSAPVEAAALGALHLLARQRVSHPEAAERNGERAMAQDTRPLALVTGASTGIGCELAKCCAQNGFDLVVAADEPKIVQAASDFRALGATVEAVEADLATVEGVDKFYAAA